jgi:hypothetical protein
MREGMYKINGRDLWTVFGALLEKGSDSGLLALPEPKARVSHDWEDEDGEEVLLTPTFTKARDVTVSCLIVAADGQDFWANYHGLYDELTRGTVSLYVRDFDETYTLLLTGFGKPEKLTRIKSDRRVGVKFSIKFKELAPSVNKYALADALGFTPVDEYGNYLV